MVGIAKLLLVGLAVLSAVGYFGNLHQLFELASHFRPQYLLLGGLVLILFATRRQLHWAAAAALVVAFNAQGLLPAALSPVAADVDQDATSLRLLLANLQYSNEAHQSFTDLIHEQNPDLIVVQEVTPAWASALGALSERYPFSEVLPREGAFGIGVLSRRSLYDVEVLDLGHPSYPAVLARLTAGDRTLALLAAHPPPPVADALFTARNEQLREVARLMRGLASPKVLLGDLNTSSWSPYFSDLLKQSGLRNARDGFGILPTWPSFFRPAMIPIDHCLISRGIRVEAVRTGPDIGSDHLPLIIDLLVQRRVRSASVSA